MPCLFGKKVSRQCSLSNILSGMRSTIYLSFYLSISISIYVYIYTGIYEGAHCVPVKKKVEKDFNNERESLSRPILKLMVKGDKINNLVFNPQFFLNHFLYTIEVLIIGVGSKLICYKTIMLYGFRKNCS